MAAIAPKKWNWWYDRIIDWMIANPDKLLGECAHEMNVSQSWLSVITNSDMFQDAFKARSKEHSDVALIGVREKAFAAADMALDALNKRLETQAPVLPVSTLLEITDVTMKRFGYAADKTAPSPITNNNYYMGNVTNSELVTARANMAKVADIKRNALVLVPTDGDGEKTDERRGSD